MLNLYLNKVLSCMRKAFASVIIAFSFCAPMSFAEVTGFADLHAHLTTEYSFGGNWLHGSFMGNEKHALPRCGGNPPNIYLPATSVMAEIPNHGSTMYRLIDEFIGSYGGLTSGDTGVHLGKRRGFDRRQCQKICLFSVCVNKPGTCPKENYEHWPSWDTIAHQQMWEGWLKNAHDRGMNVMVASLMESELLCRVTPNLTRKYDCDEMASIKRQLGVVRHFAETRSWLEIATSASHARQIIGEGKLALVLAVEVTDLFPAGDFVQQLDSLYQGGVRSVQFVHHGDNRFAGAAPLNTLINLAEKVEIAKLDETLTEIDDIICANSANQIGECDGINYINPKGLTQDGVELAKAMMERGMLMDIAHLSRNAIREAYQLAKQNGNYPLFYSHTHFWDTVPDGLDKIHKHEKFINSTEMEYVKETGGMIGLRTGPEKTVSRYENISGVTNNCQGSSRSYAQSLAYGTHEGLDIGFASDLNGFIQQMLPRFGDDKESCWGSGSQQSQQHNSTGSGFDKQGLAHVGMLPDIIQDLRNVGAKPAHVANLESSAEKFIQMWERAEGKDNVQQAYWPPVSKLLLGY